MRIAALLRYMSTCRIYVLKPIAIYWVYALALLRFINHINVPSERVCAFITLRRMFEIAYVQNFISSPVIKQMIHLIFFQNPLFIYKMHFLLSKTAWSASHCNCRASKMFMMTSYWQVHCDHIFAKNLPWRIFRAINIHLIVSTYHFVLS